MGITTIQLDADTKRMLDKLKSYNRETYNDILRKLIATYSRHGEDDNLVETLEIVSNPQEMREIAEGVEAYRVGKGKTLTQLRKELGV